MASILPDPLPTVEACMPQNLDLYYGGHWQTPLDGEYRETINPAKGTVLSKVAFAGAKDTEEAVQAAHAAFPSWAAISGMERGNLLRQAAARIRSHALELGVLDAANTGSPVAIMAGDANVGAAAFEYCAGLIPVLGGTTASHLGETTHNYTVHEPLGVVARIVACNHPCMFAASRIAAAVAVGNTVIIKTPDQAPLSALRLMELIGDMFPPGVVTVLSGGPDCGRVLSSHPLVRRVTLIGSVPTGRAIMRQASDTLKTVSFELGGKNALVAYPDADRERLIEAMVAGMNWGWCGQSCGSTSRVFLHESLYDYVLGEAVSRIKARFEPGDPLDPATSMGCMVSRAAQERVLNYIRLGKEEGAKLVLGGGVPKQTGLESGSFVEPTVFGEVTQAMRIANEEIFGPVMSVLRWSDEAKMLRDVNDVEYGLTGAVFTKDLSTAQRVVRHIQAGTVWVNTVGLHYPGMPFGGYKQSGNSREEGMDELLDMTQIKAVHIKL